MRCRANTRANISCTRAQMQNVNCIYYIEVVVIDWIGDKRCLHLLTFYRKWVPASGQRRHYDRHLQYCRIAL